MLLPPPPETVLSLTKPHETIVPLLIDSPHSGRHYPPDFNYTCPFDLLQQTEDNHLEIFLDDLPEKGVHVLHPHFPRCYIDVNRAATDIDPALLAEPWPGDIRPSIRSEAGIGLVRRLVRPGIPVYKRDLSAAEIRHRIDHYYTPYHTALSEYLDMLHYNFGQAWYLNMHSMPHSTARTRDGRPVDFVIGDLNGTTCRRDFVIGLKTFIETLGYRVALNDPYKGVELIERHSNPAAARHAVQIEINKALYWDEEHAHLTPLAETLKEDLQDIFAFCINFIEKELVLRAAD